MIVGVITYIGQAQDSDDSSSQGYAFDSVNERNPDWQPVSRLALQDAEMVLVPAGKFQMGSTPDQVEQAYQDCLILNESCDRWSYELEEPRHEQVIEEPFWIDRYETSRLLYNECVIDGVCTAAVANDLSNTDAQPVNLVTWQQARTFCETWRGGRLPTEVEWEYASRGPSSWVYPWGNTLDGSVLNYCDSNCESDWRTTDNDGYTLPAPVTEFPEGASWVGAYNMSGNLWEWTSTRLRSYPYINDSRRENPDSNDVRIIRGGSYNSNNTYIRTQARFWLDQSTPGRGVGFRCIIDS